MTGSICQIHLDGPFQVAHEGAYWTCGKLIVCDLHRRLSDAIQADGAVMAWEPYAVDHTAAERVAEHTGRIEYAPTASVEGDLWAQFQAGLNESATIRSFATDSYETAGKAAHTLGLEVGWMLRAGIALTPDLAPILDALTKET